MIVQALTTDQLQAWIGIVGALLTAILGLFKYFEFRSRRDSLNAVGQAFDNVIDALGAQEEAKRLSGAILLRRFFDSRTEQGERRAPYAKEAVAVIAALLREASRGTFRSSSPTGWDTHVRSNTPISKAATCRIAYLGARPDRAVDLTAADFFRGEPQFGLAAWRPRSERRVLRGHPPRHRVRGLRPDRRRLPPGRFAGSRFANAVLKDARFEGAKNLPPDIAPHLEAQSGAQLDSTSDAPAVSRPRVFVSCPAAVTDVQQTRGQRFLRELHDRQMDTFGLGRDDYAPVPWEQLRRAVTTADGVVVLGFRQLHVALGEWRPRDREARRRPTGTRRPGLRSRRAWRSWRTCRAGGGGPEVGDGMFAPDVWGDACSASRPARSAAARREVLDAWAAAVSARAWDGQGPQAVHRAAKRSLIAPGSRPVTFPSPGLEAASRVLENLHTPVASGCDGVRRVVGNGGNDHRRLHVLDIRMLLLEHPHDSEHGMDGFARRAGTREPDEHGLRVL